MKPFLEKLQTNAWCTSGARYNASRRLKQREWFSTFSLAVFSALSVAVAFAQKVYSPIPGGMLDNYLTSVAAALGVFLLSISLLEWGAGYGAKAEALYRNAELLNAFQFKMKQIIAQIEAGKVVEDKEIDDLRVEYELAKEKCSINHLPVDYELFRVQHRLSKEFWDENKKPLIGRAYGAFVVVRWYASEFWFFGLIWVGVIVLFAYSLEIPKS